jgi:hypothetical protein
MRYVALIYYDEATEFRPGSPERAQTYQEYSALNQELHQAGVLKVGHALQPTSVATTVRVRQGQVLTTDGPFAETKEALGGFYVFECPNLDEALRWAAKIPGARSGSVEVRPIVEM